MVDAGGIGAVLGGVFGIVGQINYVYVGLILLLICALIWGLFQLYENRTKGKEHDKHNLYQ